MRLLYVSGLHVPASGGAEISAHALLVYLASRGHRVSVVTRGSTREASHAAVMHGVEIQRLPDVGSLEPTLKATLSQERPDAVLTQGSWSDIAIKIAKAHQVPVIYFLRGAFGEMDISAGAEFEPDYVIANSQTVKQYIEEKWGRRDVLIVPPFISAADYSLVRRDQRYLTMVNPVRVKGGFLVREIAQRMPDRPFLIVRAWDHLRDGGAWDLNKLTELANSYKVAPFIPEEAEFVGLPNVEVREATATMSEIYAVTRILLVPSLVREGLPRVAVEAMMGGIPVVASAYGVRAEVVGPGGIRVIDHENAQAWIEAIRQLDDAERYVEISQAALAHAANYNSAAGAEPLLTLLDRISADQPAQTC